VVGLQPNCSVPAGSSAGGEMVKQLRLMLMWMREVYIY
jgi:hypothetical protein